VAAEENIKEIENFLEGCHMVFIAAGMGGGTGTGAAPVIAKLARERDILTVGVITKPFHFEGKYRMDIANNGIEELKKFVDTLIIIPNQNLFRMNFIYASFSGRGEENNMSFSERIFGRRQSISSIIEQETEPREEIRKRNSCSRSPSYRKK
jgi:cell division GTPase FtsZ